jgi:predicted CoA-binding protein
VFLEVEMSDQKTLIVGATTNPSRYAYTAASMFDERRLDFLPIGIKTGEVFGREILDLRTKPALEGINTITLYIGPENQSEWIDYLISLKPKRIIFNPGTENPIFSKKAREAGIQTLEACNLVLLSTNQF